MRMNKAFYTLLAIPLLLAFAMDDSGYKPGDSAIDFSLLSTDNKKVSLSDFSDAKGFIVVFTCNHCPFAKMYEDRIIQLDAKYKSLGYPVIAINPNDAEQYPEDNFENMKIRAAEKGFTFPYLQDVTQEIAKTYGATKTPHIYIVRKTSGLLMVEYIGAIDNNAKDAAAVTEKYAENALDELIAGKEVTLKSTKAVGCSVKYKE